MSELTEEECRIILGALKCLHNLKYISDIAVALQDNALLLEAIIEEVALLREKIK